MSRLIKESKDKAPFELCETIIKVKEEYPKFLNKHLSEQYQSYALGCVSSVIKDEQHVAFLKSLFDSYAQKYLTDLELLCFNMLPKFDIKNNKAEVERQIREFLASVPKLRYC